MITISMTNAIEIEEHLSSGSQMFFFQGPLHWRLLIYRQYILRMKKLPSRQTCFFLIDLWRRIALFFHQGR